LEPATPSLAALRCNARSTTLKYVPGRTKAFGEKRGISSLSAQPSSKHEAANRQPQQS